MNFKEFLTEDVSVKEIHAVIREWREEFKNMKLKGMRGEIFGSYTIEEGKVNHGGKYLPLYDWMLVNGELPIPFLRSNVIKVTDHGEKLTSFKNFPRTIICVDNITSGNRRTWGINWYWNNRRITSLEGIPRNWFGYCSLNNVPKLNLSRIDKHIDYIERTLEISEEYVGPILSTILIKHVKGIVISKNKPLELILNTHSQGDKDIMECHEDLIKAGLKEYAKL